MAEETAPKPADAASKSGAAAGAEAPKSGPNPIVLVATIVAALAAGGAAGAFLIGPRLLPAHPRPAKPAAAGAEAMDAAAGNGGKEAAKRGMYKIENLIVNPAGSQGTRFLMATVAFEVPDEKQAAMLKERDVQLRDAVISALEGDTMESLTRPGARDSIKAQVTRAVKPVTHDIPSMRIYLPQFVIQ